MWQEFLPKSIVCLKEGYSWKTFRKDLLAGTTVGIVALPLAMAFAIASGVPPERGLFTAIIAGFLISLLGGSRVQIGGPTGAFVVVVYDVIQRQGYEGLAFATLIAGVLLLAIALFRLGDWIKYIPYPLITGFTTGIAVIIFSSQIKDFFGLPMGSLPADFISKWGAYFHSLPNFDPTTLTFAAGTLLLILIIRRYFPVIPWGIAAIVIATLVAYFFQLPIETIATRFGEIPRTLPAPSLPHLTFSIEKIHELIPDAITIAFLAGIESLLSAVIADGMTGGRHKSNCELLAQGFANIGSIIFGGIPATGALARTATNIKSGAKTPVAGMIHAVVLFLIILFLAPLVSQVPLAALSAVLMMIAWNMAELHRFRHLFKAPLGDIAILLTAFFLTVLVDITVAVEVGMILSAFLFMKRMGDLPQIVTPLALEEFPEKKDPDAISKKHIPPHTEVFEVNGPLFFGVADSLKDILRNIEYPPKVFILRMRNVPVLDGSGLHALEEFYHQCRADKTTLILSGVKEKPAKSLKKYGLTTLIGSDNIFPHIDAALRRAQEIVEENR